MSSSVAGSGTIVAMPSPEIARALPNPSLTRACEKVTVLPPAPMMEKSIVANVNESGCNASSVAGGSSDTSAKFTELEPGTTDGTASTGTLPSKLPNARSESASREGSYATVRSNAPTEGGTPAPRPATTTATLMVSPTAGVNRSGAKLREIAFAGDAPIVIARSRSRTFIASFRGFVTFGSRGRPVRQAARFPWL